MTRKLLALGCLLLSGQSLAFPCFMTAVKDSCWGDYNVTVNVSDAVSGETLATAMIPKGQFWTRVPFTCQGGQRLGYSASFEPVIWAGTENRIYEGTKYTLLPLAPKPTEKAWEIPVCFPQAFPGTSAPPTATGNCKCDMTSIPPVPPMK
ncbi:hypothetical protein [Legionella sp. CNM-4043-24]|uniref:hypothetical protein n=1 Tax=Legionella sp. CNM-4043-24 TaxID=3421646 RepID=UPI00403AD0D1